MKKFLTVLLALSVVFTYSFSAVGTAFAASAPTNEQATKIKQAADYAKSNLPAAVQKAYETVLAQNADGYTTKAAWEAASADIVDALEEEIDTTRDGYLTDVETAGSKDSTWDDYDYMYAAQKLYTGYAYTDLVTKFTTDDNKCAVIAAQEQFKLDIADTLAVYDKIDVESLYSKTTPESGDTYYEQAVKAIQKSKEALQNYFIAEDGSVINLEAKVSTIKANAEGLKDVAFKGGFGSVSMTKVVAKYYEGTSVVQYYYLDGIPTISDEEGEDAEIAATTAAIKAQVAKNIAVFLKSNTSDSDKAFAEDYATFYNYLAENIKKLSDAGAKKLASDVVAHEAFMDGVKTGYAKTYADAITASEDMKAYGEKYAAEKDASGALVRDPAEVDKLVEKAIVAEYAGKFAIGVKDAYSYAEAKTEIAAMTTVGDAAKLAFDKEAKKADLDDEMDAKLADYYDLEAAKVKAAYAAAKEKVDAAKDTTDFKEIVADLNKEVAKIDTKSDVDALFTSGKMKAELDTQVTALEAYVEYKNTPVAGKPYEDSYINMNNARKLLTEYYIEKGARTVEEMKALTTAVEDVATTLPTTAALTAAEKAAKDAIAALPTAAKTTSADKAAYQTAFDLVKKYNEMKVVADGTPGAHKIEQAQIDALYNAIQQDFYLAYAKADKTDKAALKAIAADVKAANDEVGADKLFTKEFVNPAEKALETIRANEKAAVIAAIKAIPLNITLEDKDVIEKARSLYDAYVEEYTDYDDAANGYVADEFKAYYHDLALAEAALSILQKDYAIKAVESLKITASSTAAKGSITVKWKVVGDYSAADGMRVYKSTKKNSGYGATPYFITKKGATQYKNTKELKKGTRYYYKVRAYVEIDGVKYYSDWSNKAYRIAK